MRIGIVTFTTGDNFGQRLQNYALEVILENRGCYVNTLRRIDFRLKRWYWIKKSIQAVYNKSVRRYIRRHNFFIEFDKEYIKYYEKPINSLAVPKCLKMKFDKFVVGSDQVWSPQTGDVDEFYFLTFADEEQKYCYAPSFSVNDIPNEKIDNYKKWIGSFQIINTREYAGQIILKNLGFVSQVVLDPTILVDKELWQAMERKPKWLKDNQKYILKYYLGSQIEEEVYDYSEKKKCIIIDILDDKKEYCEIGPREFLYLIEHAELVFTDSYHGTIFSILMGTPFKYCERNDDLKDMSSRFETLFKWFGVNAKDRIVYPKEIDMLNIDKLRESSMRVIDKIILDKKN